MGQSKRRNWTPEQKLRIVLESLQSDSQVAEICRREGLSPNMIYKWRQQLMGSAQAVFADKRGQRKGEDPKIARLSADNQKMKDVIAEITAENIVLKKMQSD
jgi:transposase